MFPFWKLNFAYRWASCKTYNTAVLGLNKDNYMSLAAIYDHVIKPAHSMSSLINSLHPISLSGLLQSKYGKLNKNSVLKMYHSLLFDPAWLCADGILPRFDSRTLCSFAELGSFKFMNQSDFRLEEFFPGAFTYHMHLKSVGEDVKNHSYFYYIESHLRVLLDNQIK